MERDLKIMFARFPYMRIEDPDVTDWLVSAVIAAKAHPRVKEVIRYRGIDTPITMMRNRCLDEAKSLGVDFVVMIDSDMSPDAYLESNPNKLGVIPGTKPFLESSLEFAINHREAFGPCVIGAPYCGPPPFEIVYVFRWSDMETGHPNADLRLEPFCREEATTLTGISEVGALPTGLILIDVQGLRKLEPPYTYYEYPDKREHEKASTEDVTFTRDLGLIGVAQYCNWDAWSGHWKRKCVGRPAPLTTKSVSDKFRRALRKELNLDDGEEIVCWPPKGMPSSARSCGVIKEEVPSVEVLSAEGAGAGRSHAPRGAVSPGLGSGGRREIHSGPSQSSNAQHGAVQDGATVD